jgi:hypothetical protein
LAVEIVPKIIMSSLRFKCIESNFKRYPHRDGRDGPDIFEVTDELIDLVNNFTKDFQGMVVDLVLECVNTTIDIFYEFKHYLGTKVEGTAMGIEQESTDTLEANYPQLTKYGWCLADKYFDDNCIYIEKLLQNSHEFTIRFFDIHKSDICKDLVCKEIIPKIIPLLGRPIVHPGNINKRKETVKKIYQSWLSSIGNEENTLIFKKEITRTLLQNLKDFNSLAQTYTQPHLQTLIQYIL